MTDDVKDLDYYLEHQDEIPEDPELLEQLALNGKIEPAAKEEGEPGEEGEKEKEEPKPVETRDGKHTIPYSVLEGARKEAVTLRTQLEEVQRQNEEITQKLAVAPPEEKADAAQPPDSFEDRFKNLYGRSVTEFREEFGEDLAAMFEAQTKNTIELESQIGEISQGTQARADQEQVEVKRMVQEAIDQNTILSDWQQNNPILWEAARALDIAMLRSEPDKWASHSLSERFDEVCRQMGRDPEKAAVEKSQEDLDRKADEKVAQAKTRAPTSLSEFPGGAPADQSAMESIERLSTVELAAKMESMTVAQQEAFLSNL